MLSVFINCEMNASGNDDEDFIFGRYSLSPIPPTVVFNDLDESGTVTPPNVQSINMMKSLGLVITPCSPVYRKDRSKTLVETPKFISKLSVFSSTPSTNRCLKVQKHLKYDLLDNNNLSIPSSLINPFSSNRIKQDDVQSENVLTEKNNISFQTDEKDCQDELLKSLSMKTKLSNFCQAKFEKEFMVLDVLGTGDHGCVYRCLHLLTGIEYAVKRSLKPVTNKEVARNEIYAHAALEHPNIVRNFVSWSEDEYLFMQNEYCNGGSLEDYITKKGPLQEKELMILLEHLAQGIRFIHLCNLAHMDLKPGNVFLTFGPELYYRHHPHDHSLDDSKEVTTYKIGDLGHVIKVDNTGYVEDGDCRYLPREMLNESQLDYTKVDIFALGLTLFEGAGGGPLPKNGEEWHAIRDGHIKHFPHLSPQFNNLLKRMINEDPKKRPSACELLSEFYRDKFTTEDELKASYQTIHLLEHQVSDIVKSVSKSVKAYAARPTYKKQTTNSKNNNLNINHKVTTPTTEHYTRSTRKKTPKL